MITNVATASRLDLEIADTRGQIKYTRLKPQSPRRSLLVLTQTKVSELTRIEVRLTTNTLHRSDTIEEGLTTLNPSDILTVGIAVLGVYRRSLMRRVYIKKPNFPNLQRTEFERYI